MSNNKTLQVNFQIKASDQATAVLNKVRGDLQRFSQDVGNSTARVAQNIGGSTGNAFKSFSGQLSAFGGGIREGIQGSLSGVMGPLGNFTGGLSAANIGMGVAAAGAVALTAALYKVTAVLAEAREAWSGQELANQQIAAVWKSMGRSIPTDEIHAFASELQGMSVYADEQIASAARILATFPQITDDMMKPAMQTMVDFAAFANTSLDGAANAVGKAAMGMGGELRRMGITIDDATAKSGDFAAILRVINEQIGGQAQAAASTWNGKVIQLKNAWGDLLEEVGRLQSMGFGDFFGPVIKKIAELTERLKTAIDSGQLDPFIEKLKVFAEIAQLVAVALLEMGAQAGKAMIYLANIFQPFIDGFKAIKRTLQFLGLIPKDVEKTGEAGKKAGDSTKSAFSEAAKTAKDAKEDIKELADAYTSYRKAVEAHYDFMGKSEDLVLEKTRARITAEVSDSTRAKKEILDAEIAATQRKIELAQQEYEEKKRIADEELQAQLEVAKRVVDEKKKAGGPGSDGSGGSAQPYGVGGDSKTVSVDTGGGVDSQIEAIKKGIGATKEAQGSEKARSEANKRYHDEMVRAEQEYTQKLESLLQEQYRLRQQLAQQVKTLRDQAANEEKQTADAVRNVEVAAASEYDKLGLKLDDARAKLQQATELMPKFPERAMALAREARGEFAGLAQDITGLEKNLRSNQQLVADALKKIDQAGLKGEAKYSAEVGNVADKVRQAREEAAQGRTKEAEQLYQQAISQAQQLQSSAPKGERGKAQAQADAKALVETAGGELEALNLGGIDEAEAVNEAAIEGIQSAGELLQAEIQRQIEAVQKQVAAVDANTAALEALRQAMEGEKPESPAEKAKAEQSTEPTSAVQGAVGQAFGPDTQVERESAEQGRKEAAVEEKKWQEEVARGAEQGQVREKIAEEGRKAWDESATGGTEPQAPQSPFAALAERARSRFAGMADGVARSRDAMTTKAQNLTEKYEEMGGTAGTKRGTKEDTSQGGDGTQRGTEASATTQIMDQLKATVDRLDKWSANLLDNADKLTEVKVNLTNANGFEG